MDFWKEVANLTRRIGRGLWGVIQRYHAVFLIATALLVGFTLVVLWRLAMSPDRVILLTGPAGGAGERLGQALADRIKSPGFWDLTQRPFELAVKSSDGFEHNRQQVDQDTTGNLIGFAQDGFDPTPNVRVLLPLEENYVHIIVSRDFYQEAVSLAVTGERGADETAVRAPAGLPSGAGAVRDSDGRVIEELVDVLRASESDAERHPVYKAFAERKVFLGPELSGTRQTARLILNHFGVPIERIDCELEGDWETMFEALVSKQVHLAFFTTTPGAKVVKRLANRGGFILLGLRNPPGICQLNRHVFPVAFERDVYGAGRASSEFCPARTATIATRRVIVCSQQMSEKKAYWLTTRLRDAIHHEVPTIPWDNAPTKSDESRGLIYRLHPGVVSVKEDEHPWYAYIPNPFWPLVLSLMMGLVIASLKGVNRIVTGDDQGDRRDASKRQDSPAGADGTRALPAGVAVNGNGVTRRAESDAVRDRSPANAQTAPGNVPQRDSAGGSDEDHERPPYSATYLHYFHGVRRMEDELARVRRLSRSEYQSWQERSRRLWQELARSKSDGLLTATEWEILSEGMRRNEADLSQLRPGQPARRKRQND